MTTTIHTKQPPTKNQQFQEAKKSFHKIQEELRPFLRQRRFKHHTSAGQWIETASLELIKH